MPVGVTTWTVPLVAPAGTVVEIAELVELTVNAVAGMPLNVTLVAPHTVNILMSHNPDTFDRAAELGIDLSLAGHTHGGQVALEFVSPEIAPSRLVTPYVAGWFEKPGGQLYVNRGIGTIGVPMRIGAPPEITVYELIGED